MPLDLEPLELKPAGSKLDLEPVGTLDLEPVPTSNKAADFFRRIPAGIQQGTGNTLAGAVRAKEYFAPGGINESQFLAMKLSALNRDPSVNPNGILPHTILLTRDDIPSDMMAEWKQEFARRFTTPEERIQQSPVYQLGAEVAESAPGIFGVDRARDPEFVAQLGTGVGQFLPTIAAGAAAGPAGVMLQYGSSAGQAQAEEALAAGQPDKADEAFIYAAGLGGLTEMALGPAGRLLAIANRARKAGVSPSRFGQWAHRNPVKSGILKAGSEGAVREGAQEGLEQLGGNFIASDLAGYDPARPLGQGVGRAMALGAALGAGFGGGTAGAQQVHRNQLADQLRSDRAAARTTPPPPPPGTLDLSNPDLGVPIAPNPPGPEGSVPGAGVAVFRGMNGEAIRLELNGASLEAVQALVFRSQPGAQFIGMEGVASAPMAPSRAVPSVDSGLSQASPDSSVETPFDAALGRAKAGRVGTDSGLFQGEPDSSEETPFSAALSRSKAEQPVVKPAVPSAGEKPDLVLIGCGKSKVPGADPVPAADLYTGPLFKARRQAAESSGRPWGILSAAHGVVDPKTPLAPYDVTIQDLRPTERAAWERGVRAQVLEQLGGNRLEVVGKRIEVHAGAEYVRALEKALLGLGVEIVSAKKGMGIGAQLADYKAKAKTATPTPKPEPPALEKAEPAQSVAAVPAGLQDFGEKLGGARKDRVGSVTREISDADLATLPFSEIWPKADVDALEDLSLAALATALRAAIPSKPRQSYKLKRWVERVKGVRDLMRPAAEMGAEAVLERMRGVESLQTLALKVKLLQALSREHWDRVGEVTAYLSAYEFKRDAAGKIVLGPDGRALEVPSPVVMVEVDGHRVRATSMEELTARVLEKVGIPKPDPKTEYQVRGRSDGKSGYSINRKSDPLRRKLKTFETADEALAFVRDEKNHAELEQAWEAVKASDNVKETDVRGAENRPRVGGDHRGGENATPEMFMTAFGFRGVEFGNWVSQGANTAERQGMLNAVFDALMDLATIVGVPPIAISLNGTLGLGLGSRGSGFGSAHYEPGSLVINLTKTRGAGALGHEWFHALDHYFQRHRNERGIVGRHGDYITQHPETYYENAQGQRLSVRRFKELQERGRITDVGWKRVEGVRTEVAEAFAELVKVLNASPMAKRASRIDKGKSDGYWSRIIERAARSFENYLIAQMQLKGFHNDYLANVTAAEEFGRDPGRYPYLLPEELPAVEKAFTELFATIQVVPEPAAQAALPADILERLERLKLKPGALYSLPDAGLLVGSWNGAITAAQAAIRAGRTVSQAIEAAVRWLRAQGAKFDEAQFRAKLKEAISGEAVPAPGGKSDSLAVLDNEVQLAIPARPKVVEIADAFQRRFGKPIDYRSASPEQNARFVSLLVQEVDRAVGLHPEAKGWYDENVTLALDVMRELDPDIVRPENDFIFKVILAATSDGNKVGPQFVQTWKEYSQWKRTGQISGGFVSGDRLENIQANLAMVNKMVKAVGWEKTRAFFTRKGTVREVRQSLVEEFGWTPAEARGVGSSELTDKVVPFAVVLGSKLGSFFNNLYGDFSSVTMDRWFMRTVGRLTGSQVAPLPGAKLRQMRNGLRDAAARLTPSQFELLGIRRGDLKGADIDAAATTISGRFAAKGLRDTAKRLARAGEPALEETRKFANLLKKALNPLVEAPVDGTHRRWIRERVGEVQRDLRSRGVELENADLQAVLWYLEKELYEKLNYRSKSGESDYASAAAALYQSVVGRPSGVYARGTGRVRAIGGDGRGLGLGAATAGEASTSAPATAALTSPEAAAAALLSGESTPASQQAADQKASESDRALDEGLKPKPKTARGGQLYANPFLDPQFWGHTLISGARMLRDLGQFTATQARWTAAMVARFGAGIRRFLDATWTRLMRVQNQQANGVGAVAQGHLNQIEVASGNTNIALEQQPAYDAETLARGNPGLGVTAAPASRQIAALGGAPLLAAKQRMDVTGALQAAAVKRQSDQLWQQIVAAASAANPLSGWRLPAWILGTLRARAFTKRVLHIAARLNATGGTPGGFTFTDFTMRAGSMSLAEARASQLAVGDTFTIHDPLTGVTETLTLGPIVTTPEGRVFHQLERRVDAKTQREIYNHFAQAYPELIWFLDLFIDPSLANVRQTINGIEVPVFNRFAAATMMADGDPNFTPLTAYTPDVLVTRSLLGSIRSALSFRAGTRSPGRKYKSGTSREGGHVRDLLSGFNVRTWQMLQERSRREWMQAVLQAATPIRNNTLPEGWVKVETGMEELWQAVRRLRRWRGPVDPATGAAVFPQTEDRFDEHGPEWQAFFGEAAQLRGRQLMLPKALVALITRKQAAQVEHGRLYRLGAWAVRNSTQMFLVMPVTVLNNVLTNDLFTVIAMSKRLMSGVAGMNGRDLRFARELFVGEAFKWFPGLRLLLDRQWRAAMAADVLPETLFADQTALADLKVRLDEDPMSSLREGELGAAALQFIRYGLIDVRAKTRMAYAWLRAQAVTNARRAGLSGAALRAEVDRYLANPPGADVAQAVAITGFELLNYADSPAWLEETASGRFRVLGANVDVGDYGRLLMPFPRFGYHFLAQQAQRAASVQLLLGRVPQGQRAEAFADLVTFLMWPAGGLGILAAYGLKGLGDDDDEARKRVGTASVKRLNASGEVVEETLPRDLITSNRINLSAWARGLGLGTDREEDFWLRVRSYPVISMAGAALLAEEDALKFGAARGAETYLSAVKDLAADFFSLGMAAKVPAKILNDLGNNRRDRTFLDPYAAGVPTIAYVTDQTLDSFLPGSRQFDTVVKWMDPIQRRRGASKTLGFEPTVWDAARVGHLTGVLDRLVAGEYGSVASTLPPEGAIDRRTRSVAAPQEYSLLQRYAELGGFNVRPIDRRRYEEALTK